jgi:hypothetical protein
VALEALAAEAARSCTATRRRNLLELTSYWRFCEVCPVCTLLEIGLGFCKGLKFGIAYKQYLNRGLMTEITGHSQHSLTSQVALAVVRYFLNNNDR